MPAGSSVTYLSGLIAATGGLIAMLGCAAVGGFVAISLLIDADPIDRQNAWAPAMLALVCAVGLLAVGAGLTFLLLGRDAGRSSTVWIAAALMPWLLYITLFSLTVVLGEHGDDPAVRVSGWAGLLGGSLAVAALLCAAVLLGIPSTRRHVARRVLANAVPPQIGQPPATVHNATVRMRRSLIVFVVSGVLLFLYIPASALGEDPDILVMMVVLPIVFLLVIVLPLVLGLLGARRAERGRRGGATLARVGGGLAVPGTAVFLLISGFAAAAAVVGSAEQREAALLPTVPSMMLGALLVVSYLLALGTMILGLAALADPRSEQWYAAQASPRPTPA